MRRSDMVICCTLVVRSRVRFVVHLWLGSGVGHELGQVCCTLVVRVR